jgi:hypothetical protein
MARREYNQCPRCGGGPTGIPLMIQRCIDCGCIYCDDHCSQGDCPECGSNNLEVDYGVVKLKGQ